MAKRRRSGKGSQPVTKGADPSSRVATRRLRRAEEEPLLGALATLLEGGKERTALELLDLMARTWYEAQVGWTSRDLDDAMRADGRFLPGRQGWSLRSSATGAGPSPGGGLPSANSVSPLSRLPHVLIRDSPPPDDPAFATPVGKRVDASQFVAGHLYTWNEALQALEHTMGDDSVRHIMVTVGEPRGDAHVKRYAVDLLLLNEPRWIVSTLLLPEESTRRNRLTKAGWLFWADPNQVDWMRPQLHSAGTRGPNRTRLATYKTTSKRYAARTVLNMAHAEADSSTELTMHVVLNSPPEISRQRSWTRRVRSVARRNPTGPVLNTCAICGQPLTTSESALIGIGPQCLARLRETGGLPPEMRRSPQLFGKISRARLPISYWVRATPVRLWSGSIARRLRDGTD